jgi:hypothetical protein
MSKNKPTTGPMRTQPIEHASIMPIQVRPVMPTVGMMKKVPQPSKNPLRRKLRDANPCESSGKL